MKKLFILIFLISIVFTSCNNKKEIILNGVVEATIFSHFSEVKGKIVDIPIELGKFVNKGDIIAIIDDTDERYALKQQEEILKKKEVVLLDLKSTTSSAQIRQAKNNINISEEKLYKLVETYNYNKDLYEKNETLYEEGAIPEDVLDASLYQLNQSKASIDIAKLELQNSKEQLIILNNTNTNPEKIKMAESDIKQTKIQIEQIKNNLEKYKIISLNDGIIISKNYNLGSIIPQGSNIAEVSNTSEKYIIAYLPVKYLSFINYNDEIEVKTNAEVSTAKVSYINLKSEYTPKDAIQGQSKSKKSVKIKLLLSSTSNIKIGEEVQIYFKTSLNY